MEQVILSQKKEVKEIEHTTNNEEAKKSLIVQSEEVAKEKKKGKKKAKQNVVQDTKEPSEEKPNPKEPAVDILKMEKICDDILDDFNSRLQTAYQITMSSSKLSHFQTKS